MMAVVMMDDFFAFGVVTNNQRPEVGILIGEHMEMDDIGIFKQMLNKMRMKHFF